MIKKKLFLIPFLFLYSSSTFCQEPGGERYPRRRYNRRIERRRRSSSYRRQEMDEFPSQEVQSNLEVAIDKNMNVTDEEDLSISRHSPKEVAPFWYFFRKMLGLILGGLLGIALSVLIIQAGWMIYVTTIAETAPQNTDVFELIHDNLIRKLFLGSQNNNP